MHTKEKFYVWYTDIQKAKVKSAVTLPIYMDCGVLALY